MSDFEIQQRAENIGKELGDYNGKDLNQFKNEGKNFLNVPKLDLNDFKVKVIEERKTEDNADSADTERQRSFQEKIQSDLGLSKSQQKL
jgi:hypothetical protein